MQQYHSAHNDNEFNNLKSLYYLVLLFISYSFIGAAYAAESDPPVLNAISVDKTVVDVSNGPQTVTFNFDAYDESGIDRESIYLRTPSGQSMNSLWSDDNPNQEIFTFDPSSPSGNYAISNFSLYDNHGNYIRYNLDSLTSFGLPYYIEVIDENSDFDFDKDGTLDALTDGLLFLRYAFGLRGDNLTNAAIGSGSSLTSEEVATNVEQAASVADIDNSGTLDALTDGLILLRYAFGLRGDNLVSGAISSDATRTLATDIEAYVESHMP